MNMKMLGMNALNPRYEHENVGYEDGYFGYEDQKVPVGR
jgi:hypothetical protein